jgi:hypothetical protein
VANHPPLPPDAGGGAHRGERRQRSLSPEVGVALAVQGDSYQLGLVQQPRRPASALAAAGELARVDIQAAESNEGQR